MGTVEEWVRHAKQCDVRPRELRLKRKDFREPLMDIVTRYAGNSRLIELLWTMKQIADGEAPLPYLVGEIYGFRIVVVR